MRRLTSGRFSSVDGEPPVFDAAGWPRKGKAKWACDRDLARSGSLSDTSKGTYCGTFGAEDITSGFSEFLGYFMPRKVIAGDETMKAAGTVVKKLARWLVEKGCTEDNESVRELVGGAARDLPASQKTLAAIREHPQLKGYLEPGAPPGYLLLKSRSDADNFVPRCQDLGFDVRSL